MVGYGQAVVLTDSVNMATMTAKSGYDTIIYSLDHLTTGVYNFTLVVEDEFGIMKAVASGNMLILAKDWETALKASEDAKEAITKNVRGAIMPFPGGLCRAGSKVGSLKYKLPASTNHQYCPTIRKLVEDSEVPEGVGSVYEIVINGLNQKVVKKAMGIGINAAIKVPGVVKITAGNYGGKLGPYRGELKEVLELE